MIRKQQPKLKSDVLKGFQRNHDEEIKCGGNVGFGGNDNIWQG